MTRHPSPSLAGVIVTAQPGRARSIAARATAGSAPSLRNTHRSSSSSSTWSGGGGTNAAEQGLKAAPADPVPNRADLPGVLAEASGPEKPLVHSQHTVDGDGLGGTERVDPPALGDRRYSLAWTRTTQAWLSCWTQSLLGPARCLPGRPPSSLELRPEEHPLPLTLRRVDNHHGQSRSDRHTTSRTAVG